ncbi:MAG: N-acetylmuramoyl-L-alanine amidase, partial [Desulfotomaculum sp.]|nr:N-acetylmuramoyl-L-alanine amidase [Desulfotomaculum sp.]
QTAMPALLLENLFIDNPSEAVLLRNHSFCSSLAEAASKGIAEAMLLDKPGRNLLPL